MGLWPIRFLLIFIFFFGSKIYSVYTMNVFGEQMNVGTTLFDKSHLNNHCWTNEEFVILSSRKVFQDLLPKMVPSGVQNDEYINELLNYIHICLEYVNNMSVGKTKHLMLKSLADALGGYLHSYAVPIVKVSFYAGNVNYYNVYKILKLLDDLKIFLHTNGEGWKKIMNVEMYMNDATPMIISIEDAHDACNKLILNYTIPIKRSINRPRRGRLKNKRFSKRHRYARAIVVDNTNLNSVQLTEVFLPYLDSEMDPNSLALPFKDHNLWSLHEEESVGILNRYYETCINCISSQGNYEKMLADFNENFYRWLLRSVYPRLNDDKWYPAFGGVLRVIAFLQDKVKIEVTDNLIPLDTTTVKALREPIEVIKPSDAGAELNASSSLGTTELVLIALSCAALLWILVGLLLVCYRYLRKRSEERSQCVSPKSKAAVLFKNDNYFDIGTCSPLESQKSIGEKIKDWWRQTFKTCPGGCDRTIHEEKCLASYSYKSNTSVCSTSSKKTRKKRSKKFRTVSVSVSPSSSPCEHYTNSKFHYSTDLSSSNSDSSFR